MEDGMARVECVFGRTTSVLDYGVRGRLGVDGNGNWHLQIREWVRAPGRELAQSGQGRMDPPLSCLGAAARTVESRESREKVGIEEPVVK